MPASPDSMPPPTIWITRPLPVAERTASQVAALGLIPLVAPLLSIHALAASMPPTPPHPRGWIFTSRHAPQALREWMMRHPVLQHAADDLQLLPAWCVGARTAEAARAAGFVRAECMGENGIALSHRLGARLEQLRGPRTHSYDLWYAAGSVRRHDMQALLSPWEVSVHVMELYESRPAAHLPHQAEAALRAGTLRAALLYSPETARAFTRLMAELNTQAGLVAVCLSQAVANACPPESPRIVAPRPTEAALLQSLDAWAKNAYS